jgi:hypothetical protein
MVMSLLFPGTKRTDDRLVYTGDWPPLRQFYQKLAALYTTTTMVTDVLKAAETTRGCLNVANLFDHASEAARTSAEQCQQFVLNHEQIWREFHRERILLRSPGGLLWQRFAQERNFMLRLGRDMRGEVAPVHDPRKAPHGFHPDPAANEPNCEALSMMVGVFADLGIEKLPERRADLFALDNDPTKGGSRRAFERSWQKLKIDPQAKQAPRMISHLPLDLQVIADGIDDEPLLQLHEKIKPIVARLIAWEDEVVWRFEEMEGMSSLDSLLEKPMAVNRGLMDQAEYFELHRRHLPHLDWFVSRGEQELASVCREYEGLVRGGGLIPDFQSPKRWQLQYNVFGLLYLWNYGRRLCERTSHDLDRKSIVRRMVEAYDGQLGGLHDFNDKG